MTGDYDIEKATTAMITILSALGLEVKLRSEHPDAWIRASEAVDYLPVDYSNDWIEYQIVYWKQKYTSIVDASVVIYHDTNPAGIWPLSICVQGEGVYLGSNGGPLLPPLFNKWLARKSLKSLTRKCLDLSDEFSRAVALGNWVSSEPYAGGKALSAWHVQAMERGAIASLQVDMFVDLSLDMATIKNNLRKSHKSLVVDGKYGNVCVLDRSQPEVWEEFRLLHFSAAGRETRSRESWQKQYLALSKGSGVLVYLCDQSGRMIGGAFYNLTKDEGYYSVGAYDRSMFDKPLGHPIQYRAIEEMKRRGLCWFRMGPRPYMTDEPPPSEKRLLIVHFQESFATHHFPRFVIARMPQ